MTDHNPPFDNWNHLRKEAGKLLRKKRAPGWEADGSFLDALDRVLEGVESYKIDPQQQDQQLANTDIDNQLLLKERELSRKKDEFFSSMSHELRTPLTSIIGCTEFLNQESLNSQQQELVDTIERSGNGLLALVNDILDRSKIESGKFEIDWRQRYGFVNLTRGSILSL